MGIALFSQANELLREVFQLGPPPLLHHPSKADKHEKVSLTRANGRVVGMNGGAG